MQKRKKINNDLMLDDTMQMIADNIIEEQEMEARSEQLIDMLTCISKSAISLTQLIIENKTMQDIIMDDEEIYKVYNRSFEVAVKTLADLEKI